MSGVVTTDSPTRCSENARLPWSGQKAGPFHHCAVNGILVASHQRIQVLRSGSPGSGGIPWSCNTTGKNIAAVKAAYAATTANHLDTVRQSTVLPAVGVSGWGQTLL